MDLKTHMKLDAEFELNELSYNIIGELYGDFYDYKGQILSALS